ncbi:MAG: hypothetical protein ABIA76_00025 [Candidatus Diapherotrites archaeon]
MEEMNEKQIRNAVKIIERMAGHTQKFRQMHAEIKKETAIEIRQKHVFLEEIKLPKLSELKR